MLGRDQPVILQLLEIPDEKAQNALKGVIMELEDCAFPLLAGIEAHSDPMTASRACSSASGRDRLGTAAAHMQAHQTASRLGKACAARRAASCS